MNLSQENNYLISLKVIEQNKKYARMNGKIKQTKYFLLKLHYVLGSETIIGKVLALSTYLVPIQNIPNQNSNTYTYKKQQCQTEYTYGERRKMPSLYGRYLGT